MHHLRRVHNVIEFRFGDKTKLERRLFESEVVLQREVCDLRGLVIADDRSQRRDQHQGTLDVLLDPFPVWLGAFHQKPAEVRAAIRHQSDGMRDVVDDERLIDVYLQIAGLCRGPAICGRSGFYAQRFLLVGGQNLFNPGPGVALKHEIFQIKFGSCAIG